MLKLIARLAFYCLGPIADILGLIGAIDDFEKGGSLLNSLHEALDTRIVYVPLLAFGTLVTIFAYGRLVADFKIKKAGGISGFEFSPKRSWDDLDSFPAWQAVWLWNGIEPQGKGGEVNPGSPVYGTYQVFKQHLDQGLIPDAVQVDGSWSWTRLTRQQLIDYAFKTASRPKFLFKNRRWRWPASLFNRGIPPSETTKYEMVNTVSSSWLMIRFQMEQESREQRGDNILDELPDDIFRYGYRRQTSDHDGDFYRHLRAAALTGTLEAIGRVREGNLLYEYRKIPRKAWKKSSKDILGRDRPSPIENFSEVRIRSTIDEKSTILIIANSFDAEQANRAAQS